MHRRLMLSLTGLLCLSCPLSSASAAIIFIGDESGNVAKFDSVSNTGAFLGTIAPFQPGQAIGLAYNPASSEVLILDRNTDRVFRMNDVTGAAVLAFNSSGTFQGGAVSGGLVYGTSENSDRIVAFDFAGTQQVTGSILASHTHSTGVDPSTGQVYLMGNNFEVFAVNPNGTLGAAVVTATGLPEFVDDMDYFGGDFLVTAFANDELWLVDGGTGVSSLYLSSAQLNAMGLTNNVSGVALQAGAAAPVPEPASLTLFGLGAVCVAGFCRRRWSN